MQWVTALQNQIPHALFIIKVKSYCDSNPHISNFSTAAQK